MKKRNSGITLVALVITIIVLIILAGEQDKKVMNDGLITNAKNAKNSWKSKAELEEIELAKLDGVLELETLERLQPGAYTGDKNKKYVDSEGNVAVIPAGFTVSNIKDEANETDETTISKGLVIYSGEVTDWDTDSDEDGIIDAQENYNQYVWIPMDNPGDMYGTLESPVEGIEGTKFGKLYKPNSSKTILDVKYNWPTESGYSKTHIREPGILSSYDTDSKYYKDVLGYNSVDEFREAMIKEFDEMTKSVEKYKGFYIGRYEMTRLIEGYNSNPSIRRGKAPIVSINWYNFYKLSINIEAENQYANQNVKTSIAWMCQRYQVINKCLEIDSLYLTSRAKVYGVYSDSVQPDKFLSGMMQSIFNTYDLGGTYGEFVNSVYSTGQRVIAGGAYSASSTSFPPNGATTTNGNSGYGDTTCRVQLYIK